MHVAPLVSAMFLAVVTTAAAQSPSPQQLMESGQHDQALQSIAAQRERGEAGPGDAFLAGLILVKIEQRDRAGEEFARLAATGDPAWTLIGESATALLASDNGRAREAASQAIEAAPGMFQAQYQLGLAKARFEDWAGCAEAFRRAAELNPAFAYAHYYAGLSYSRSGRADRTSEHFERFLKLAPRAPERAAVESLMRTLRGR